ncbi:MAG: DUF1223 domain-containing protein [Bacteroidota bacterium]
MKRQYIILIAGLLIVSLGFAFTRIHRTIKKADANTGFALVELYTSEGCSSCPPADKLLAKIAQEYKDKEVYVLAYHVDYWNHLGWKDVFSNPQYSARQRAYSGYLNLDGVYTPQAIVNGRTEFVGSDEGKMHNAIQQSLTKAAIAELILSNVKIGGNKATLQYHVSGAQGNSNLLLAVIEKHAQSQVKAGENNGRMLPHINIVQKLQTISFKNDSGNAEISLPDGFNTKEWGIVGFVQSSRNGEIQAASKVVLDTKELAAIK